MRVSRFVLIFALLLGAPLLAHPGSGIVVDRQGRIYFMDTGGGVWKIDAQGRLTQQDPTRFHWMAIDLDDRFARGRMPSSPAGEFSRVGAQPTIIVSSDVPIAMGTDGAFYYPERGSGGRLQLLRWTASGDRSVFATLPSTTSDGQPLQWLNGLAAGPDGSMYYSENTAVRRVSARGEISTVAERVTVANCSKVPGTEPGEGVFLRGLDVTADGTVYVAAAGCGALLRIGSRGEVRAVLRTTAPWSPTAAAVSGADVIVLEYLHTANEDRRAWIPRVRRLRPDGTAVLVATVERK
jgi:SMP-30/gluconolaconase/LRE-like protein